MRLLLEVEDEKAPFLKELLSSLPYVTTNELSTEKAQLLFDLVLATQQVKQHKEGNLNVKSIDDLLSELK